MPSDSELTGPTSSRGSEEKDDSHICDISGEERISVRENAGAVRVVSVIVVNPGDCSCVRILFIEQVELFPSQGIVRRKAGETVGKVFEISSNGIQLIPGILRNGVGCASHILRGVC